MYSWAYLPLHQRFPVVEGEDVDHLPEDEGDGVGLLVQVEAHLGPDVVIEVDTALGAGNPPLCLPPISPQLESEAVWNKILLHLSLAWVDRNLT